MLLSTVHFLSRPDPAEGQGHGARPLSWLPVYSCKERSVYGGHQRRLLNPLDPNPAVAARAVFPQSGHSHPEKRPFFHIFPHFSKKEQSKKYLLHIGLQYIKLKPMKVHIKCKKNYFILIKTYALVTLNLGICSKFSGNFMGTLGNPGEIPHI